MLLVQNLGITLTKGNLSERRRNLRVYVLNMRGQSLMPTTPAKAKRLLETNRAKVVKREPFTIQLQYATGETKQPITLGIDAGSKTIGLSASTEDKELYSSEIVLRTDVTDNLSARHQFRRARRNRKTRYRKPRFSNRKKPNGWLAPTIEQKIGTHLKVIENIHKILPISKIIVETAAFDIQKIKNPNITGAEYQQGDQMGFWNVREYVLFRDGHMCQHCKGKSKDKILNVHHIESRKTGGDIPNNLITLCKTCHNKHHRGEIQVKAKRGASFRDAAFMGIMRWAFYGKLKELYPSVNLTYGYITKNTRIKNNLSKEHRIDAFCIAGHPQAKQSDVWYFQKAVRRHNRQLHKAMILRGGYRKANQAAKYVFGYQLFDKVLCEGTEGFVFARRSSGYFDIRTLDGVKLSAGISYKKLRLLARRYTLLTERMMVIPPLP